MADRTRDDEAWEDGEDGDLAVKVEECGNGPCFFLLLLQIRGMCGGWQGLFVV